jgi:hypothetical protein
MKWRRVINLFVIIVLCGWGCSLFNTSVSEASVKKYVTSKNFVGTYYMKGFDKTANEEHGAYNVTIGKLKKSGDLTLYISYIGRNYSSICVTDVIKTRVKGNKATFKWKDSWGNKGKGIITLTKKHRFNLTMKETKSSEFNRVSLEVTNETFFYYDKWHDLSSLG